MILPTCSNTVKGQEPKLPENYKDDVPEDIKIGKTE